MINDLFASLRRRSRAKRDRETTQIVESRGGAMLDRCQRGACHSRYRAFPFRQLPALRAR